MRSILATTKYCYYGPCINPRIENDYYCEEHADDYERPCSCKGCVRDRMKPRGTKVPRCHEEARSNKVYVTDLDTGGHAQCLEPLNADGTCPNAHNHHSVWVARHFA